MTKSSLQRKIKKAQQASVPLLGQKPEQTPGLYAAGKCEECRLPVFYHGAPDMDPKVYTCCGRDCNHQMSLTIPPQYSPDVERVSCNMVFRLIDLLQKGAQTGTNPESAADVEPEVEAADGR